ncbi:ABC transporter permease [Rhodopirellula sp. P2]|uniref:ABC transporter permease n=1 Tax=Rhodopirellula sp. P2 TaxID=2127060 RepID=UPI0023683903|nr:ABC transporter permease [Rhodopirellula sp. P2]WDQ16998.1 ABC transporter permease [Rhodopirellula sp. P2]
MVWKVIEIHLRRLRHNRIEWLLTFVVPIAFFSIFALIFSRGVGGTPRVKVALIREVGANSKVETGSTSLASMQCDQVIQTLRESEGLRLVQDSDENPALDRAAGEDLVRRGSATIAIVLSENGEELSAELLNDASDQVASQVVSALVMRAMLMAKAGQGQGNFGPDRLQRTSPAAAAATTADENATGETVGVKQARFEQFVQAAAIESAGDDSSLGTFPRQPDSLAERRKPPGSVIPEGSRPSATEVGTPAKDGAVAEPDRDPAEALLAPPEVKVVNVMGEDKTNPVISVYAAGIAVMFLLFGATSGGGVLLEERENQTLERLLSTQMTMDHLLLGKWFYLTLLGCVQVTVMFVWAQLVFGLDLLGNLDGFVIMTLVTSAAAASFGLFLATLCKTRGQLNGLSVVAVLTMSALGGSMVPRYVMSEGLREAGLWTFNAWALDGYDKVFWRELPPSALQPQLAVLMATAFGLLVLARLLAIRWETS